MGMASVVHYWDDAARLREGAAACMRLARKELGEGRTGLKIHFGEPGNTTHIDAGWLTDAKAIFDGPSFVECNVLYRGKRTLRADHVKCAADHGFGFLPVDILDGEMGEASADVPVNAGRTAKAKLGAGLLKYERLVALTHFKGHMATGFGGALKNVGMGLGSRPGKLDMHAMLSPVVRSDKCVACGRCAAECPADAISLGKAASIDPKKCIGCVHCIAVCPQRAIDLPWGDSQGTNEDLMEKIAEYALAAVRGRGWYFINFVTGITLDCDCFGIRQEAILPDIGIVAGSDPVAVDAASLDLVKERNGGKDPFLAKHGVDGRYILSYAKKLGLGGTDYELKRMR
jgi:uncharacterized protein